MTIIEDGQLRRFLGRERAIIPEQHIDTICIGLERVVDQFRDRVAVSAISEIANSTNERLRDEKAELGTRDGSVPNVSSLSRESRSEYRSR